MKSKYVLAIGNSGGYETEAFHSVLQAIRHYGHDALLFRYDKCMEGESACFEVQGQSSSYSVVVDSERYDISTFSSVLYLKPQLPISLLNYQPAEHRNLVHRQFEEMLRAVWSVLRGKRWINDPWAGLIAENKIHQLTTATQIGLSVPDTLVTVDPDRAREFYDRQSGNVIFKLLAPGQILGKVMYTNRLTTADLTHLDEIRMSPVIFQSLVRKAFDLRITIVGDEVFPIRIHSQVDEETALDWRRKPKLNDFDVKMEPCVLPRQVEQQLQHLMRELGLRFGCVDMVETPNGGYIFLEVNPNGQWYFVQLRTGAMIAASIAKLLVGEH